MLVVVLGVEVVVVTVVAVVTVFVRDGEVTVVPVVVVRVGCTIVVVLPTLKDGVDAVDELFDELLLASSTTTTTTAATATAIPPAIAQPRPPPPRAGPYRPVSGRSPGGTGPPPGAAGRSPGGGSKLSDTQATLPHPVRDASSRSDHGAVRACLSSCLPSLVVGLDRGTDTDLVPE